MTRPLKQNLVGDFVMNEKAIKIKDKFTKEWEMVGSMAWGYGNSSGKAVLWVTLLHGSESTCVCDASECVRKSCHKSLILSKREEVTEHHWLEKKAVAEAHNFVPRSQNLAHQARTYEGIQF